VDAARCAWRVGGEPAPERWFAGVLGAGFDAIVNERANGWRWPRGRSKYVLAMLRELPVFRPRAYTIELDGEVWSTPAMLVAVGNGPSYGGGMRVTPDAHLDDGLLDVMVVEPVSRPEFLRIFPRVYAGTHVDHPAVTIRRARSVTVAAPGIVGYGDGERFGPLPMTMTAVPRALSVLAGHEADVPRPARRADGVL
jgi:diacylglycerol kinase (ATP)